MGRWRGRMLKGPGAAREICMEGAAGQGERELRVQGCSEGWCSALRVQQLPLCKFGGF